MESPWPRRIALGLIALLWIGLGLMTMNFLNSAIRLFALICQFVSLTLASFGVYYLKKLQVLHPDEKMKIINNLSSSTGAFLFAWILLNFSGLLSSVANHTP
jgi:hypothetical protein